MMKNEFINNRYRLLKKIGEGGSGTVFLAQDSVQKNKTLALKKLHRTLIKNKKYESLKNEFESLIKLHHPNLVQIYDLEVAKKSGELFLTMEYLEGKNILELAPDLDERSLVDIIVQICRALDYIHSKGIIHRDIKSENLLIVKEKEAFIAKLMDFGLAKALAAPESELGGTLFYASPEILKGEKPTEQSDLYALGMVLYRLSFGRYPFKERNASDIINWHLTEKPRMNLLLQKNIPAYFPEIILNLLQKEAHKRFNRASMVIDFINRKSGETFRLETKDTIDSYFKTANFIGRKAEIQQLKEALSFIKEKAIRKANPIPTLILIEGESGIGKSRLLKEFKNHCRLQEIDFLSGCCYVNVASAYDPFMEILKNAIPLAQSLLSLSKEKDSKLQKLIMSMNSFVKQPDKILRSEWEKHVDPEEAKMKLIDAISDFFITISELLPFILAIEDLQWSDDSTLSLLEFISRNAKGKKLLIVAAIRKEDITEMPVHKFLIKSSKWPFASKISLNPLAKEEVLQLVTSMIGKTEDVQPLTEKIHEKTAGNPFFVEEIVKNIAEDVGAEKETNWQEKILRYQKQITIPETLKAAIMKRVDRLNEQEQSTLKYLSVMNRPVPFSLLHRLLPFRRKTLEGILDQLTMRELLETEDNGEKKYLLGHSQVRESVYLSLSHTERLSIHSNVGQSILQSFNQDLYLEDLAYHFSKAEDHKIALHFLLKAAEKSRKLYAHDNATNHYKKALHLLPRNKKKERTDLLFKLGETYLNFGAYADAIECFNKIRKASKIKEPHKDIALAIERMGWSYVIMGNFQKAKRCSRESFEMFKVLHDEPGMANSIKNLGLSYARSGSYLKALKYFSNALKLNKKINDQFGIIHVENNIGLTYFNMGKFEKSETVLNDVFKKSKSQNQKVMMMTSLNNLGIVYKNIGMRSKAIDCYKKAISLEEKIGDKLNLAGTNLNLGELLKLECRYEQAIQLIKKAAQTFEWLGNVNRQAFSLNFLGDLLEQVGKIEEAIMYHRKALNLSKECHDRIQEAYSCLSLSKDLLFEGKTDEARSFIDSAFDIAHELKNDRLRFKAFSKLMNFNNEEGHYHETLKNYEDFAALSKKDSSSSEEIYYGKILYAEALLKANKKEKARKILKDIMKYAEEKDLKEFKWLFYFYFAALLMEEKKSREAQKLLKKCIDQIYSIASSIIEESLKKHYLEHPKRKNAFELYKRMEVGKKMPRKISEVSIKAPPAKMLATLYEIVQMINSILDPNELLEKLMDLTLEVVGAERGLIILFDEKSGEMSVKIARNMEKETIKDASRYSRSIVKEAKSGKSILTLDAINDKRFKESKSVSLYEIHSLMCVPLKIKERIIGTVYLDSRKSGPLFAQDDLYFVEALANHAAIAIEKAQLYASLKKENEILKSTAQQRYQYANIIGKSKGMNTVFSMIERVVDSTLPVLIIGESGTGKELVARAIHFNGPRRNNIFLSENCSAISETLLESELFGHMKGAFTGASNDRKGLFELASHGTLFLDEIGNMSLSMQSKLLRAIQEGEIRPIGGKKIIKVNPRIISASNMDLKKLIEEKKFREDLYYRLNVIQIIIPPLRERKEDIPLLMNHFLEKASIEKKSKKIDIYDEVVNSFMNYHWPGNVRELENAINRLSLLATNNLIDNDTLRSDKDLFHLMVEKVKAYHPKKSEQEADKKQKISSLKEKEKELIISALNDANGNRLKAAKILGISRATIFRKIKQYHIH